ncbi:MAG: 50S ribosomal protein L9 [Candidatus Andersenbacteria bacterium]
MASKSIAVLLRQDVKGFGKKGEVKQAAAGFARNYLLPKKIVGAATDDVVAQVAATAKRREAASAGAKAEAQKLADGLAGKAVTIRAKAGEKGKLFGSVSRADVAAALKDQLSLTLASGAIDLDEPLRQLGKHEVKLTLAAGVTGSVTVQIVSEKN